MKLATLRTGAAGGTVAVRVEDGVGIEIPGVADVGDLLAQSDWRSVAEAADGSQHELDGASYETLIPDPSKIICVGLNYRTHILEMGRDLPEYPTLFAKFRDTLIGPFDDIEIPSDNETVDWECELVVVIGKTVRGVDEAEAAEAIAGYTVMNDISMRDWQFRTREWLQGKVFQNTTPVGPVLVTSDEWEPGPEIRTVIDGEVVQQTSTSDLLFTPANLVSYISQMINLRPGDIIATGTPGGVGHARKPPRYLSAGSKVETTIEGIGTLVNTVVAVDSKGQRAGTF
jgi:acylpyruvate hydrolase